MKSRKRKKTEQDGQKMPLCHVCACAKVNYYRHTLDTHIFSKIIPPKTDDYIKVSSEKRQQLVNHIQTMIRQITISSTIK